MGIDAKAFEKSIQNAVNKALNGDGGPFSKMANAEQASALEEVVNNDKIHRSDPKYVPMTDAQIKNKARERASDLTVEKIKDGLQTAQIAGDDKSNMIEFALGMAFGGSGSTTSMIMNVLKGDSPFWKTVKESFSDGKLDLASFSDRWKNNVQDAALTKYAEKNGISKNELVAALSQTDGAEVKLAKVPEDDPSKTSAQQKANIESQLEAVKAEARLRTQLQVAAEQAAAEERKKLEAQSGAANADKKEEKAKGKKTGNELGFSGGENVVHDTAFSPTSVPSTPKTGSTAQQI